MFALAVLETQSDAVAPQMMFAFLSLLEQQMTLHGYRGFAAECLFHRLALIILTNLPVHDN